MTFIQRVTTPQELDDSFPILEQGVAALNPHSRDKWFAPRVYADILQGVMNLYLIRVDWDVVGFALTSVEDGAFMVNATYIRPGTKGVCVTDVMLEGFEEARALGLTEVRFKTRRAPAFERALEPLGFSVAHVELVAEVPNG